MPIYYYPNLALDSNNWPIKVAGPPRTEHIGRVARLWRRDKRVMSDIYADAFLAAIVADDGSETVVEYGTNFELDMRNTSAEIDITPELQIKHEAWKAEQKRIRDEAEAARWKAAREAAEEAERNRPVRGKRMRVVRGRKVPKGTEGVVFWVRDGRVGLDVTGKKDSTGRVLDPAWVDASYLKAV